MLKHIVVLFIVAIIFGCNQKDKPVSLNDPLETGREFIDASLKGNYDRAQQYMLIDSTNKKYLESLKDFYKKMSPAEKDGYKNANIIINPSESVTDSTTIINYTNTYKNKPSKIRIIKINNEWRVDFKYTFAGDL